MTDDEDPHWTQAHEIALDHLNKCFGVLLGEEEKGEDPACAPFCGCETCVVREVLFAAAPYLEKHFNEAYLKEIPDAPPA